MWMNLRFLSWNFTYIAFNNFVARSPNNILMQFYAGYQTNFQKISRNFNRSVHQISQCRDSVPEGSQKTAATQNCQSRHAEVHDAWTERNWQNYYRLHKKAQLVPWGIANFVKKPENRRYCIFFSNCWNFLLVPEWQNSYGRISGF